MLHIIFGIVAGWFSADIHVPLDSTPAGGLAKATNEFLGTVFTNEVNLETIDKPHVTLCLTQFQCAGRTPPVNDSACRTIIEDAIFDATYDLHQHEPCVTHTGDIFGMGNYAMLAVKTSPCLQFLSDRIVNATYRYAQPNQPVPPWVLQLPEPQRSKKIRLVKKYGSPNCFSGFSPHITVGWGENTTLVADGVRRARPGIAQLDASAISVGRTGPHGTVLRGKDYASYNLSVMGDECRARYASNRTGCLADRLTDGGCVWCDIVDHPATCFASTNARRLQPPPQGQPFMCDWAPNDDR